MAEWKTERDGGSFKLQLWDMDEECHIEGRSSKVHAQNAAMPEIVIVTDPAIQLTKEFLVRR